MTGWGRLLFLLFSLFPLQRAEAEPKLACGPSVLVEGDPDLVASLQEALQDQHISTSPAEDCAYGFVKLQHQNSGLLLSMIDPYGRVTERQVSSLPVAIALVESWLSPVVAPVVEAPTTGKLQQLDEDDPTLPVPAVVPSLSASLTARVETSIANDASLWAGVLLGGCFTVTTWCIGGAARFDVDARVDALVDSRWGLGLLFTLEAPRTFGRGTITPGFDAGLGWLRATLNENGDNIENDEGSARVGAHLSGGWLLGRGLQLEGNLAAEVVVLDGGQDTNEDAGLPESPRLFFRFGLGIKRQSKK